MSTYRSEALANPNNVDLAVDAGPVALRFIQGFTTLLIADPPQKVAEINPARRMLVIANRGSVPVYIADTISGAPNGFELRQNERLRTASNQEIWAFAPQDTGVFWAAEVIGA